MYCTSCGAANPEGANFCTRCGQSLQPPQPGTTGRLAPESAVGEQQSDIARDADVVARAAGIERPELDPGQAVLVVIRGPNEGARFLLDRDETTCGRHPDSDIFLDDVTVSRHHVTFHRDDGTFVAHDNGSLNGTYVNGQRVDRQELATGDEVQVGRFKLVAFVAATPAQ